MQTSFSLVLLDLDGTTVVSKGDALPSRKVIGAVKKAQGKVHVAVATGRNSQQAKPATEALELHGPSVFNGGAEIINLTNHEIVYREVISTQTLRKLVKVSLPFKYKIYIEEEAYTSRITSPDDITVEAAKLLIEAVDTKSVAEIFKKIETVAGTIAHTATSWSDGDVVDIHVTNEHATKKHGVERLIAHLGIDKKSVLAIGDGHNDIPLLEAAGTKVAMGNAPDEVKAIADFIAPSLDEDGVAVAIERYILN
jgi:HAD superfamily hydrolase (TIGR01484 family)